MIVSASRRTDIPAFYSEWFMNRLQEGFVYVKNPLNPKQISKVILDPEVVDCIVFWTKNVQPMLQHLDNITRMGYPYYFLFTLTPYDRQVEKHLAPKTKIITGFKALSEKIGKQRILWRYDPIIVNESFSVEYHLQAFELLCGKLCDSTTKCIFSYVDLYAKTRRNAKGIVDREADLETMEQIAQGFSKIAHAYQIRLQTCCEETGLGKYGISHGACIDPQIIEELTGCPVEAKKDPNQRRICGCMESVDIGAYDSCPHGCVYCYAARDEKTVGSNIRRHDVHSPLLIGKPSADDKITDRAVKSYKNSNSKNV